MSYHSTLHDPASVGPLHSELAKKFEKNWELHRYYCHKQPKTEFFDRNVPNAEICGRREVEKFKKTLKKGGKNVFEKKFFRPKIFFSLKIHKNYIFWKINRN